jgi:AcrR family transcriptional regulator
MDETTISGMPRGLALLWGVGRAPTRGPKPGLSIEQVVEAAMAIADEDGLAQVSMARVAERLGFTTMSLYRYVEAKDDLLTLMFDAGTGPPPRLPGLGRDWRRDLERWARKLRERYQRHPWVLTIPISGPIMTPNQFGWLEAGLRAFDATGLDDEEKANLVLLLSGFVRNEMLLVSDLDRAERRWAGGDAPPAPAYGEIALRLLDEQRYPSVVRALENGLFDGGEPYGEPEFAFGLARVLDGIGVLVDERAGAPRTARRTARATGRAARARRTPGTTG